jgi:hypothetical protein
MTFATANRVAMRYVAEVTENTTPNTPALQALRFTSESLNNSADFTSSQEIRADRMTPDTIQTSLSAGGDINGELSYQSYDDIIEAAMFSTWQSVATEVVEADDITLTKTAGTPNTWVLTASAATDFTADLAGVAVGQFVEIVGFPVAGRFYAEVTSVATATLGIKPLTDVATEAEGYPISVIPLDYVRNGTTSKSFTFQKSFTDLNTVEYWNFTGSKIGEWSLDFATGSILTTTFSVLARDGVMTEAQFASASIVPASTSNVMNAVNDVTAITFDGDPGGDTFRFNSLSLSINNALRGQEAIGTLGFIGVVAGRLQITGDIELYFEDSSLFDRFRASTAFQLTLMVQDSDGNAYILTLPRCKYTSMEIVAGGLDTDIFASASLEAIINSAGTYQVQLSRRPVANDAST